MTTVTATKATTVKTGSKVKATLTSPATDPFTELPALRSQFAQDYEADKKAKADYLVEVDNHQAVLLQRGMLNALELLKPEHRKQLEQELTERGVTIAKDDLGLFSGIAKLQLGDWGTGKVKKWVVPSQRDKRQSAMYRIFYLQNADADKNKQPLPWDFTQLAAQIVAYKGRVDGILKAYKDATAKPDDLIVYQKQVTRVFQDDEGLGRVPAPGFTSMNTGKKTDGFVLALVSVHTNEVVVHKLITNEPATRAAMKQYIPARADDLVANARAKAS